MAQLRQVLIALGDPLVEVEVAPDGLAGEITDVVVVEPDETPDLRPGDLALVIGARGRAAVPLIRAAGRRGAAAAAVKVESDSALPLLRNAATDAGIALLAVAPDVRWEQLAALVRGVLEAARGSDDEDTGETLGDLFSLAQTIAALTGGSVSIEDTASRVLAYSRSDDEVDELRRLSILGRQGPAPYLAMLREWGVYQRLRATEEVVRIEERPDLGIRTRIAVGVHAGGRPLGSIWVQEGTAPFADGAEQALVGAARVAALHLVQRRSAAGSSARFRENLLAGMLDGRSDPVSVARQIGADPAKPAAVVAFASREAEPVDRTELELRRSALAAVIAVHAAAYRRSALVTQLGDRTYAFLPDLPADATLLDLTREMVAAAGEHVQAAVGRIVSTMDEVGGSRQEADRVLDAMGRGLGLRVATLADVRSQVLVSETLAVLADQPRLRDPRLTSLRSDNPDLATSLLAYLDALGDVRSAAARLHVHPNTLRYRVRRAAAVAGIDLDDPLVRLFAALQLRLPPDA
ncbi:helix-turn-helix domain-containing protein [Amycolatopsis endophytica]|uniref:DNA-binding PucR family transcriptional regulator n=1 Tax=Amycolatopsis endophytica TaxID=860233 RepID=A0A853BCX0_9PSEU|nr:PucR family transcriptional regulator [Amycolatopsis endophytica]NYI92625.1 DNA-binding PucR family transcriptional regulator [Amycolatopsis endophytica]